MARESARNGTLTTKMETMLASLQSLEACTTEALSIVQEVLGPQKERELHKGTVKKVPKPRQRVNGTANSLENQNRGRFAIKVIKSCLKIFDIEASRSETVKRSYKDDLGPILPRRQREYLILAQISAAGFAVWSSVIERDKLTDLLMTRTNLISRLLDAELASSSAEQIALQHNDLTLLGNVEPTVHGVTAPYSSLLVARRKSPQTGIQQLVHALQCSVLRLLHLGGSIDIDSVNHCIQSSDGPLPWCKSESTEKTQRCVERIFQGTWRLSRVCPTDTKLSLCLRALSILVDVPSTNIAMFLDRLGTILISSSGWNANLIQDARDQLKGILTSQKQLSESILDIAISHLQTLSRFCVKIAAIELAQEIVALINHFRPLSDKLTMKGLIENVLHKIQATDKFGLPDTLIGIQQYIVESLTVLQPSSEDVNSELQALSHLCSTFETLSSQELYNDAFREFFPTLASLCRPNVKLYNTQSSFEKVMASLVRSWTRLNTVKHHEFCIESLLVGANLILEITGLANYQSLTQAVGRVIYNTGGKLFLKKQYETAFRCLTLAVEEGNVAIASSKHFNYIWQCALQNHDYTAAQKWLSRALQFMLEHEIDQEHLICDFRDIPKTQTLRSKYSALFELIEKLENLLGKVSGTDIEVISDEKITIIILEIRLNVRSKSPSVPSSSAEYDDTISTGMSKLSDLQAARLCCSVSAVLLPKCSESILSCLVNLSNKLCASNEFPVIFYALTTQVNLLIFESVRPPISDLMACMARLLNDRANLGSWTIEVLNLLKSWAAILNSLRLYKSATAVLSLVEKMSIPQNDLVACRAKQELQLDLILAYLRCGQVRQALCHVTILKERCRSNGSLLKATEALCRCCAYDSDLITPALKSLAAVECSAATQSTEERYRITIFCQEMCAIIAEGSGFLGRAIQHVTISLTYMRKLKAKQDLKGHNDEAVLSGQLADLRLSNVTKTSGWAEVSAVLKLCMLSISAGMIREAQFYANEALRLTAQDDRLMPLITTVRQFLGLEKSTKDAIDEINSILASDPDQPLLLIENQFYMLLNLQDPDTRWVKSYESLVSYLSELNSDTKSEQTTSTAKASINAVYEEIQMKLLSHYFYHCAEPYELDLSMLSDMLARTPNALGYHVVLRHNNLALFSNYKNDPIYGVLNDSVLSFPSIQPIQRPSSSRSKKQPVMGNISVLAGQRVNDLAKTIFESPLKATPTNSSHNFGKALMQAELVQQATALISVASINDQHIPIAIETARGLPLSNEVDRSNALHDDLDQSTACLRQVHMSAGGKDCSSWFSRLDSRWHVITIDLAESQNELLITQLCPSRAPLTVSLPFSRHASRDADEDILRFKEAKTELLEIVSLNDATAQNAKHIKTKAEKNKWWKDRQSLDKRLQTLLHNIQRCWLGGFRGMFNNVSYDEADDQFRLSFAKLILKHVKLNRNIGFDIDVRVLSLFTDLGRVDDSESLELLEDLLYFVLDIYQYHGVAIAYDEIDIDEMTVEVQTLLNTYHEKHNYDNFSDHLFLILDADLHALPWESMDCLRGRSVSRIPSLTILQHLLARNNELVIERQPGSYILNPAGDLKTTQATFEKRFGELKEWQGIVARQPTETEILASLEISSIYAYFGHGGGEQYVRANKLKGLKRCAVAILMGCSSGALKEQGRFEPWGTPFNYMVAGSACIVANLWDVTDKDIDRFSSSMLERWSLLPTTGKAENLALAASRSRDECFLRYLNGAAPIIYGLPVMLKPV